MNKKLLTYPIIIIFVLYLFFILGMSLVTPSALKDDNENRELAQRPFLNEMTDVDSFAQDWDSYVSDQFPFRNHIIEAVNTVEEAQGATVVQDVYTLDSDYLFMFTYPLEDWRAPTIARLISAQQDKTNIPFVYIITPYKNILLSDGVDGLSSSTDEANRNKLISAFIEKDIAYIDLCTSMHEFSLEERSDMYYKSDVHWTDKGAYEGSKLVAKALADMSLISKSSIPHESDFVWSDYTGRAFIGDIATRQGLNNDFNEYIPIYELVNKDSCYYFDSIDDSNEISRENIIQTGLSESETLNYSSVSMRNYPYLRVENPHANEDMSVLILKDSLQCATIDYFSQMFSEVNIVDPRYTGELYDFSDILEEREIDLVLCMYHCNNASSELIQYIK